MMNNTIPLPNKQILVCKWFRDGDGEILQDYEEINSNNYNPSHWNGGWEYVEATAIIKAGKPPKLPKFKKIIKG